MIELAQVLELAKNEANWITSLRRQLHRFPEIGFELPQTSLLVRDTLSQLGISFQYPIAKTGIVAQIGTKGPCVALRADMDALKIHEEADVDFRSEIAGRMHACGHDCHTAMLLGAAKILKGMENQLPGIVKLIFQPAEETGGGAALMVEEGVLKNPEVKRIFGIHVWPMEPTGVICGCKGSMLAAVGSFRIRVQGQGSHAAFPHTSRDPILASAQIISALQSIVSRECDPVNPTVISVTRVSGGNSYNVIPDEVEIWGTIRSLEPKDEKGFDGIGYMRMSIQRIASSIAEAMRCTATLEQGDGEIDYPPTSNDEYCWEVAKRVAREFVAADKVVDIKPVMGAEDFSFYSMHVQACFIGLGISNPFIGATEMVHKSKFKVDEDALPLGTAMHVGFALRSLDELANA